MGLVPAPLGPIAYRRPGPLRHPTGRPPGRGIPETIVLAIKGTFFLAIKGTNVLAIKRPFFLAIKGAIKGTIAVPPLVPVRPGLKAITTVALEGSIGSAP